MNRNMNGGFIGKVVLLIIAIIALKYFFGFDILEWLKSPEAHKIYDPAVSLIKDTYTWLDNFVRSIVNK